jgi:FKBP-type peptidyl-prolyl cis-trans isomerase
VATKTSQRIFIWVIAIVMTVGTLAGFVAMVLAPKNQQADQKRIETLTGQYQKEYEAYQAKVDAQAKQLSSLYFAEFSAYKGRVAVFDKDAVKALGKEDLKIGDGAAITKDSLFYAYYIGWNPSGEIFDQSIEGSGLKAPIEVTPGGVITGWTEGVDGMKIGGVRELTIPADKAYGDQARGDKIPANSPLKFVIMIIPAPEKILEPPMPAELQKFYSTGAL